MSLLIQPLPGPQGPTPPTLPEELAAAILPVPYNATGFGDAHAAGLPPTQAQVQDAASRLDASDSGLYDAAVRGWSDYLVDRAGYQARAHVLAQAEAAMAVQREAHLADYVDPLAAISRDAIADMAAAGTIGAHSWQAQQLHA